MMATTRWKIYRGKDHVASCRDLTDATNLVIEGDKILDGSWRSRPVVWHEGHEVVDASAAFDVTIGIILARAEERYDAHIEWRRKRIAAATQEKSP